jgi:tetratricopeptide (TPR) repeat protein
MNCDNGTMIIPESGNKDIISELGSYDYWPALAMHDLEEKRYSEAIRLCMDHLKSNPRLISGQVILARALFHSGQYSLAGERFYKVLELDPENLVALKYIGYLMFRDGDCPTAFSYYSKIFHIDQNTTGLCSPVDYNRGQGTRFLTIIRGEEITEFDKKQLKRIPFRTETIGDLLLSQSHFRLALAVYRELACRNRDSRLIEKIEKVRASLGEKERKQCTERE